MPLFRKSKVELPDELVVKIDFQDNDSKQQRLAQDQVELLDKEQSEQKEDYLVSARYPIVRIGTAQRLLQAIAETLSADMAPIKVNLDFLEQVEGRHGYNQEHRYDVTILVDYAFKNLTVPVLTDLFNNDNYDDWDFEAKQTIAQAIVDLCADGKGIISGDLAKVPEAEPLNGEEVVIETVVPSGLLADETDEPAKQINKVTKPNENSQKTVTSGEVVGPTPDEKLTPDQQVKPAVKHVETSKVSPVKPNKPTVPPKSKVSSETPKPLFFKEVAQIEVLLPRFEVQEIPAVSPDNADYVQYRMNERAKQNNQAITQVEQQINTTLTKTQFELSKQFETLIDQKINERDKAVPLDREKIRQDILGQSQQELAKDQKLLRTKVNGVRDNKIAAAQATFDRVKNSAEQEATQDYEQQASQLTSEYQQKAEQQIHVALEDGQKAHEQALDQYRESLSKTSETDLRAQLLAIQEQAQTQGTQIIQKLIDGNTTFEAQVTGEHSNALNAATAAYRAQTNWQHVSDTENEVTRLKAQNQELQTSKAKLETNIDDLTADQQQQSANRQQLEDKINQLTTENQTQSERLDKLISAATGKEASAAGMSTNDLLSAILLGQYRQANQPAEQVAPAAPVATATTKSKWGPMVGVIIAGFLFLGGTGLWVNQHNQAIASQRTTQTSWSRQLAKVESRANAQSTAAKSASQKAAANQSKLDETESAYKQRLADFENGAAMATTQSSVANSTTNK